MAQSNLSDLELLQIAKEVQENPQQEKTLTNYLTEEEKEAVKKIVQSLRASAQAMKLYIVKTQYIDALRIQEERKAQLAKAHMTAAAKLQKYREEWLLPYQAVLDRANANLRRLNEQQMNDFNSLNATIDEDTRAISRALLDGLNGPNENEFRLLNDIKDSNALIEMNRYMIGEGIAYSHEERDMLEAMGVRRRALNRIQSVGGQGLRTTVSGYIKAFDKQTRQLRRMFGQVSTAAVNAVNYNIRKNQKYIDDNLTPSVNAAKRKFDEATEKADELRQETNILGKWYILAAMGDVLVELGQNLAY